MLPEESAHSAFGKELNIVVDCFKYGVLTGAAVESVEPDIDVVRHIGPLLEP